MSASQYIRRVRCDDALGVLMSGKACVFFTLTTPDVVEYEEVRTRWRNLRHWLAPVAAEYSICHEF